MVLLDLMGVSSIYTPSLVSFDSETQRTFKPNLFTSASLPQRKVSCHGSATTQKLNFSSGFANIKSRKKISIPRSGSGGSEDDSIGSDQAKVSFGYSRKDVLAIGVGVTLIGVGLKSGLEFVGVDPLQAGNVVQLVLVLGLTIGWISTYIFRVSNKEMTYAQQLRDYENKVMEKRLEGLTEAEVEELLEQVEEEKRRLNSGKKVN
ncbi:hypothetical protein GIB67_024719 [Kingdonia uniflora]|uniref:Uncharacterized protein n=1 Tax=Kingdonia uniflora TaxID=39325 RepID=A0A7J7NA10_9MAGN|nr:hypothetical protein GIB67_024719 [Kingdonia uniflora]